MNANILKHLAAVLAALVLSACTLRNGEESIVIVSHPSVIGFATDASHTDFEQLNDVAVAQDDFVTSWSSFVKWAESAGITAETAAPRFTLMIDGSRVAVREHGFGYVLIEPSGRRKTIAGVQTEADLIHAACTFFLAAAVQEACAE